MKLKVKVQLEEISYYGSLGFLYLNIKFCTVQGNLLPLNDMGEKS